MTPTQLKPIEAALEKRGYKKWTTRRIDNETYMWAKSFGVRENEHGEREIDYQVCFRVFDWREHGYEEIWITATMLPANTDNRLQCDYSLHVEIPDIDSCERMMKDFYRIAIGYLK